MRSLLAKLVECGVDACDWDGCRRNCHTDDVSEQREQESCHHCGKNVAYAGFIFAVSHVGVGYFETF